MTDERTKLHAVNAIAHELAASLCKLSTDEADKIAREDVMQLVSIWRSKWDSAISSQQTPVPAFIDRDGEYIPPLSDRERATKFGEAIAKGLSQIGKPIPAGLDEVALRVAREIYPHVETEEEWAIAFARRLVAELTKGQEPAATKKVKP